MRLSVSGMKVSQRLAELTRPTGEEDLLAVQYPEPRLAVAPKQAAAAVGIVLVLVCGWFVLRDDPPESEWGCISPPDACTYSIRLVHGGRSRLLTVSEPFERGS